MADEATIGFLREIRDLQAQQLELMRAAGANQERGLANQERALAYQERSLANQQESKERQQALLVRSARNWIFLLGAVFIVFFLVFFRMFFQWLLGHRW